MAVLDVLEEEKIPQTVPLVGNYLVEALGKFLERCPFLGDIRGRGLFIGLEWVEDKSSKRPDPEGAMDVVNRLRNKGILISNAGVHRNIIKIRPPLVLKKKHADRFLNTFEETLQEINGDS